ncbi:hypothetical protein V8C35DRAFT_306320 [Trichoderma chlorosporum]
MYLDCTFRQRTPSSEPRLLLLDTSLLYLALYVGPSSSHLFIFLLSQLHTCQKHLEWASQRLFSPQNWHLLFSTDSALKKTT